MAEEVYLTAEGKKELEETERASIATSSEQ